MKFLCQATSSLYKISKLMNVTISYQRFACFGVSLELVTHLDSKTQASYNVKLSATSYGRKHTLRI